MMTRLLRLNVIPAEEWNRRSAITLLDVERQRRCCWWFDVGSSDGSANMMML